MNEGDERSRNSEAAEAMARGITRLMRNRDETCLTEFTLKPGRRVDVITLDRKGLFTVIEIKSSISDFRSDNKWQEYLDFCDRFYFAVPLKFPTNILPTKNGLIIADGYSAEILRESTPRSMNAARRKALTLRFARTAATRLMRLTKPLIDV